MRTLIALAAAGLVAACGTTPTSSGQAVPTSTVLSAVLVKADPANGILVVRRDTGVTSSACAFRIMVDGTAAAELGTGEMVTLYVPPGDHILSTEYRGALCSASGRATVRATAAAGKRQSFRVGVGSDLSAFLEPAPN